MLQRRESGFSALFVAVIAGGLSAAGCGSEASSGGPSPTEPDSPRFLFAAAPCEAQAPDGQAEHLECGVLSVPENWNTKGGRTLRLKVAVLKSTAPSPESDPFVYVSGGPGLDELTLATGLPLFTSAFAEPIQSKRDLVFLDQRGTGLSEPTLDCPEVGDAVVAGLASPSRAEEAALRDAALRACLERLDAEGTDFTGYTSAQMGRDLEALRSALGYDRLNLWGVSYGTRVSLTAARDMPSRIRSVILDSIVPLEPTDASHSRDFGRAFHELALACSSDEKCGAGTPDLEASLRQVIASLDASPLEVNLVDPVTKQTVPAFISGYRYNGLVQQAMYATDLLPLVPSAIAEAAARGRDFIELAVNPRALANGSEGVLTAVLCQEKYPFAAPELATTAGVMPEYIAFAEAYVYEPISTACDALALEPVPSSQIQPLTSDVPALILTGAMDPVTPPQRGRQVEARLPNSHYLEFPGFGHGILRARSPEASPRCAMRIVAAFLDDPARAPDATCIDELPSVPF